MPAVKSSITILLLVRIESNTSINEGLELRDPINILAIETPDLVCFALQVMLDAQLLRTILEDITLLNGVLSASGTENFEQQLN